MSIPLVTKDGYRNWLDCPVCTEPCRTIAPFKRNAEHPYPWWEEGMTGKCQCGAELEVEAEDGRAWFIEVGAEEPTT